MVPGFKRFEKKIVPVILLIFLATGCSSAFKTEEELDKEQFYFDRGIKMMEKKDYLKAVTDFQILVDSFPGSSIVDHAQFMLAEAHFKSEEYVTAVYEYERVYKDYPSSRFAPEAHYRKALCYYMESPKARLDQENTQLAIDEFYRFMDNYPSNPFVSEAQAKVEELRAKLAYKEYMNGRLYNKNKKFEAALIYYRFVISEYPRTIWAHYARFGIGEVHFKKKEYEQAKSWFQLIINVDVDAELKEKAEKMLDKIEEIESK